MGGGSLTVLNQEKEQVWRCPMTISDSWALDSIPRAKLAFFTATLCFQSSAGSFRKSSLCT